MLITELQMSFVEGFFKLRADFILMQYLREGSMGAVDVPKGTAVGKPLFDYLFCIKTYLKLYFAHMDCSFFSQMFSTC